MGNHAVGMGTVPGRRCIGGKTGMHNGNGRMILFALQIIIEAAQLFHQKHALIDNRPGGQGTDISIIRRLLEFTPYDIKPAVKVDAFLAV